MVHFHASLHTAFVVKLQTLEVLFSKKWGNLHCHPYPKTKESRPFGTCL